MTMKRYMRIKATGAWVKDLEWGGSALEIPPENHCANIAEALDMDPAELEAVDRASDPRKGKFVSLPVQTVTDPNAVFDQEVKEATSAEDLLAAIKKWRSGGVQ